MGGQTGGRADDRGAAPDPTAGGESEAPTLTSTVRRGASISAVSLAFVQVVSFVQTLVLARILDPHVVGIFYSGTVLTSLLVTFSEGGLRNALVQRRDNVEAAANTVLWASIAAGTLWSVLALVAAPLVGLVFDSRDVALVAAVTAGSLLLYALTYVPDSLLQRRFDFRQRIFVQPSVTITFATVSVGLALGGFGVWALVVASYASQVTWVLMSWSLARWRPRRGMASVALWREMAAFGLPLVFASVLARAKEAFDTAVVGRVFSPAAVGQYRYGSRLGMLPGTVIVEVGSYVLFPAFARAAADKVRFRAAYLRSLRALWFAAMPVTGMIIAFGSTATVLLLGEPWGPAGVLFAALAASGPGFAMAAVGHESIKGHGRTSLLNIANVTAIGIGVVLLLVLAPTMGLLGVGLSISAMDLIGGSVSLVLASPLVGASLRDHLDPMLPPLVATVAATSLWAVLEYGVIHADQHQTGLALLILVGEVVGYALTHMLVLALIAPSSFSRLRQAVFPRTADVGTP